MTDRGRFTCILFQTAQKTYPALGPKALARRSFSFYSIYMNNTLYRASVILAFIFVSSALYAQKGKIAGRAVSAATQKQVLTAAQRASLRPAFPGVKPALYSTALSPSAQAVCAAAPVYTPQDNAYFDNLGITMDLGLEKKILNYAFSIEQERADARRLVNLLHSYQTLNLNTLQEDALLDKISETIVNHSLQEYLLNSMASKNYMQMIRELANYYSLSVKFMTSYELRFIAAQDVREVFAQTALSYMKDHPHKMNVKLREIMKSPAVNDEIKSALRGFVAVNRILPQHETRLLTVLREAYKQHAAGVAAARSHENISKTVAMYHDTLKELRQFVKRYNRSPRWNAPLKERRLYNRLLMLITHNQANHFKLAAPYIAQIQKLLEQYPHIRMTAPQTQHNLRAFALKYNRLPRLITEIPAGETAAPQELELFESMIYWQMNDKSFAQEFTRLKELLPKRSK